MTADVIKKLARECGFELAGVASATPPAEADYFRQWVDQGYAGEMGYLTDRRAEVRRDPRNLLPTARSIVCVGKLYNTPDPRSSPAQKEGSGRISRYAWGDDYHDVLREGLERLAARIEEQVSEPFDWKICVDTAPLLERAYAQRAGLGWIAKNTCLINEQIGSWIFLGELLVSFDLEPDMPPPDRCGTCTRCIDACPTDALIPVHTPNGPQYALDSRLCISYFTIELRGPAPEEHRSAIGSHVFGCDICQDVCPWNSEAPLTTEPAFQSRLFSSELEDLAALTREQFLERFRRSPVKRAKYAGLLGNVAVAMGNSGESKFREPLESLARSSEPGVAEQARWGLLQLQKNSQLQ